MCICVEVRIHMYLCMYVGKHAQIYICFNVSEYICKETCMIMYVCRQACVSLYTYICMYVDMYTWMDGYRQNHMNVCMYYRML